MERSGTHDWVAVVPGDLHMNVVTRNRETVVFYMWLEQA